MITCFYFWNAPYASLFLIGVLFAERSLSEEAASASEVLPAPSGNPSDEKGIKQVSRWSAIRKHLFCAASILFGAYIGTRTFNVPAWWPFHISHFRNAASATLIVFGLARCQTYRRPLNWAISQYIGEVSFGIYVMQKPLMSVPFIRAEVYFKVLGRSWWVCILHYSVFLFSLLWAADYFTRIDRRVIAMARWVEGKMFA